MTTERHAIQQGKIGPFVTFSIVGQMDEPLGGLYLDLSTGWLSNLWVDSAIRRKGMATSLLMSAIEYAKENNIGKLVAATHPDNKAAHGLFMKHGARFMNQYNFDLK